MPATIWIPAVLRRYTGGRDELSVKGATIAEALAEAGGTAGRLLGQVVDQGRIRPRLNLFLNGTEIRGSQGLLTPVGDGDEIAIIPSIAGGR